MTATAILRPAGAECRTLLADGRVATITASRRPRANRADVKCVVPASPALAARMQQVVRLARHTETRFDSREQVVLSMDCAPNAQERGWELAAVLADRLVRGVWQPGATEVAALGWSDAWHLGNGIRAEDGAHANPATLPGTSTCDGRHACAAADVAAALRRALPGALLIIGAGDGAPDQALHVLSHLGSLHGHSDPCAAVSTARAWFPLYSGGVHDALAWVEVSVTPLPAETHSTEEEETIAVPELNVTGQLAVRQALAAARHFDGRALGRWRTLVRFSEPRFHGTSYELALVMADRLARGREFVPRGRLIATGCSSAWHAGRVDPVQHLAAKLALIAGQAAKGDRVLVPELLPDGNISGENADSNYIKAMAAIRERGATVARIAHIGMI